MLKNRCFEIPRIAKVLCAFVFATFLLGGCSGLTKSDAPAISTWWLEPLAGSSSSLSEGSESSDNTTVIVDVTVVPGLDTAKILNLSPNAELNHYSGARWADELPDLLNSIVGRTLDSQSGFQVVNRRASRDLDRCTLELEVRAFYAELNQAGSTEDVHIEFAGEFRCKGEPSRYLKVDSRTPVKADKIGTIVSSFQIGLNSSLEQLLTQIN